MLLNAGVNFGVLDFNNLGCWAAISGDGRPDPSDDTIAEVIDLISN